MAAQARLGELEMEKDAALQSLLEVAQMRTSPSRQSPRQPDVESEEQDERGDSVIGSSDDAGADGSDRNGDAQWSLYPDIVAVHTDGAESRIGESTRVPCDDGSKGPMEEADFDHSGSRVGAPGRTPPRTPGGPAVVPAAGRRRNNDGDASDDFGWASSGGTGEHVCRVCGAPAPSFRKLFDCRLSLDRARAEAAEARAREAVNEEGAASEIQKVNCTYCCALLDLRSR